MRPFTIALLAIGLSLTGAARSWAGVPQIGTTFSQRQCAYLGLDWRTAYSAILELDWDIIRLGAYWDQIEAAAGHFDFADLDWQIQQARQRGLPVILTVGIKAPRWPEYFIPAWIFDKTTLPYSADISDDPVLRKYALRFIEAVITHYQDDPAIHFIQVGNEALNKFGGKNWQLSKDFLKTEVDLVRSMDKLQRPIILTAATQPNKFMRFVVNLFTKGRPIRDNLALCDILGINVYPIVGRRTLGIRHYIKNRPRHRAARFEAIIRDAHELGKPVWVTELQAEPWEPGILAHKDAGNPPSASPEMTRSYFDELAMQGFPVVLFWGAEYWYYQKTENHNPAWWDMARDIMRENQRR